MAEEQRYESSQSDRLSHGRASESSDRSSGDPLAELARLMGQDRKEVEQVAPSSGAAEVPEWLNGPAKPEIEGNGEETAVDVRPDPAPAWRGRFADLESVLGRSLAIPPGMEPGHPGSAETPRAAVNGHAGFEPQPNHAQPAAPQPHEEGSDPYRTADYDGRYEAHQEGPAGQASQSYYAEDATPPHSADQPVETTDQQTGYELPPPMSRRSGLQRAILAVLGLVVVGSVGAYGYRSLTGHTSGVPPIIKASTEPAKVLASAQGADSQSAKQIYDRLDNPRGQQQAETMVPRQEEPIALPPQVVQPAAAATQPSPASVSTVNATPAAVVSPPLVGGTPTNGEPKKVHTVTIRPDQPSPAAGQDLAAMAAAQPWPAVSASVPAASAFPTPPPAAAAPAPPATATTTATPQPHQPARPPRKPRTAATAPTAIGPQGEASSAAEQVPASPTPRSLPPPTRVAALPPAAEGGHYAVQLSSQRSEAEAHASFRAVQQKYPTVLAGREALVRRVDLGSRGIYYRAQVGPFPTLEEANRMCNALKAAGGQCIIQHD